MTVLYRALWTDARADARDAAMATFAEWFEAKAGFPLDGTVDSAGHPRGRVERADADAVWFRRAALVETPSNGSRWETTLRVWPDPTDSHRTWLWVDVDAVAPGGLPDVRPAAPRFVHALLLDAVSPVCGPVLLSSPSQFVRGSDNGEQLAETLTDPDRQTPVVVFADAPEVTAGRLRGANFQFLDVPSLVARQLAGAVSVVVVDRDASDGLCAAVGRDHGVWGGACRIYLPGLDPAIGKPWQHPVLLADRYLRSRDTALAAVRRAVATVMTTQRPPAGFGEAKAVLDAQRRSEHADVAWIRELESENEVLSVELRQVKADLAVARAGSADTTEDLEGSVRENARLRQQLVVVQQQLAAFWEGADPVVQRRVAALPVAEIPAQAGSCSEAVELASSHLGDRLRIPAAACRDLLDLDAAPEAVSWGQKSWDGLLALHAYAEHLASGDETRDFWNWCAHSGHARVWPANSKHLSMRESESVSNRRKFVAARTLPISTDVDPSGTKYMEAHLKIATGGGMMAPRIYFYVDGERALVHVGYFGPHKHMPNTKTN